MSAKLFYVQFSWEMNFTNRTDEMSFTHLLTQAFHALSKLQTDK